MTSAAKVIGLDMDVETAQSHIKRINMHLTRADTELTNARSLIWELHEYGGWSALGYASWKACVTAEFEKSASTIYRQLNAAMVELDLSPNGQLGMITERTLRPLTKRAFDQGTRQAIFALAQEVVGEGGKVTSGIIETVIEGFKDMLASGTTQDSDGNQTLLSERMSADLVARVREKKIAHKEHIRRMDKPRDYILGGRKAQDLLDGFAGGRILFSILVEAGSDIEVEKIRQARKNNKPVYVSIWTED